MAVIQRSFQKLDEDTFVPLYKALVRTHLDYACCIWSPYKQKYKDALENVQRRATKQINGMSDMSYPDRLRKLKAKLSEISSDTHQLHYTPKHHFII